MQNGQMQLNTLNSELQHTRSEKISLTRTVDQLQEQMRSGGLMRQRMEAQQALLEDLHTILGQFTPQAQGDGSAGTSNPASLTDAASAVSSFSIHRHSLMSMSRQ